MILEEIVGGFVSILTSLFIQAPLISHENQQLQYTLFYDTNPEQEEVNDGLIHREYETETSEELPYYESGSMASIHIEAEPDYCESLIRSLKANMGFLTAAVFILASFSVGLVFFDLNTTDVCVEWNNVSQHVQTLRMIGMSAKLVPLFSWFPVCIAMLWGYEEFRKNYLACLFVSSFVPGALSCAYRIIMFKKFTDLIYNAYR